MSTIDYFSIESIEIKFSKTIEKNFFFQSYQRRSIQNYLSTKQKQSSHENQFFRKQTVYYFDNENRRHFENVIKKNSKRVYFTIKFKQREFQQKKFLFYEKYRQKLFQQKFFYISKKKREFSKKNDFKLIFNYKRIHDRNRTTNFYADDSQFISKKKRRFQIVTKKKSFRRKYKYDLNYDWHDNWKK